MTHHIGQMLQSHPRGTAVGLEALRDAIETILDCAETCTMCADACLGEDQVDKLVACIRLNLDCAKVCEAAGAVVGRQTEPSVEVWRPLLQACATVCRACGDECEKHASMHEHCRVCADTCRQCEEACNKLLEAVAA